MIRGSGQGRVWLRVWFLSVRLCLGQADDTLTGSKLPALLEQLNALITLQNAAFCSNGAASFKARMLAHGSWTMEEEVCLGNGKIRQDRVSCDPLR